MLLGTCFWLERHERNYRLPFFYACQLRCALTATRVRAHFKNIDQVVATIKNKDCKKDFHDVGLPSPPDPVITRWATWLRAALYYSENLPAVRTNVNNWTCAGLLVS